MEKQKIDNIINEFKKINDIEKCIYKLIELKKTDKTNNMWGGEFKKIWFKKFEELKKTDKETFDKITNFLLKNHR